MELLRREEVASLSSFGKLKLVHVVRKNVMVLSAWKRIVLLCGISPNSLTRILELWMPVDMRRNDDAIVISDNRTILQSSPFHVAIVGVEECRGAGLLLEEGAARRNERILTATRVVAAQTSFVWNFPQCSTFHIFINSTHSNRFPSQGSNKAHESFASFWFVALDLHT